MAYDGSLSFDTKVSTEGFQSGLNKLTRTVQGMGAFKLLEKGFQLVSASIDKAMGRIDTMEQFSRVMNTMTGSVDVTNEALSKTADIVTGTAYGLDVASKSVQNFVSRGMEVDKATETVEGWGNAVAFYGNGSNAAFASVTDALSKMQTKGNVTMEQMEMLLNAGIPAIEMYADAMGISAADVTNIMSTGKLSATDFIFTMNAAMASGTEKFPTLANAAKEAGASWSASFDNMQASITRGVQSVISSIDETSAAIGKPTMREGIALFGKGFETVLKTVAKLIVPVVENLDMLTMAVIGTVAAFAAGKIVTAFGKEMKLVEAASVAAASAGLLLTPITDKQTMAEARATVMKKLGNAATEEQITKELASIGIISGKTFAVGGLATGMGVATVATTLMTAATTALSKAIEIFLGPVGWIVAGIGLIISGITGLITIASKGSKVYQQQSSEIETLSEKQKELASSTKASAATHEENIKSLSAEGASSKKLAENIATLSAIENKSADDKRKLVAYVELLNEQQDGLNLSYNVEGDQLSINAEKLTQYVKAKNEISKANAWLERQNELYREETLLQENLQVLDAKELELTQQLGAKTIDQGEYNKLLQALNLTRQEYIVSEEDIGLRKSVVDAAIASSDTATAQATIANADAVAADQIANAEATAAAEESEMQRRSDALITYTEAATNMFSRIKTESEVSVGEMIANLEFNQEALTQWADNLVMLGNRGVNEGLLQTLRNAGPESAATVSALVTASDEQLARLSEVFASGSTAATNALMTELGLPEVSASGTKLVDDTATAVLTNPALTDATTLMIQTAKTAADDQVAASNFATVGEQIAAGITAGINAGASGVVDALVSAAISAYNAARYALKIRSPSALFRDMIGLQTMKGWAQGVKKGAPAVVNGTLDTVSDMQTAAQSAVLQAPSVQMNGFVERMQSGLMSMQSRFAAAHNNQFALTAAATTGSALAPNTYTTNLYQTINTHDSLSPAETTREGEAFLERAKWRLP